jgi:PAS domain S-box-containing protein
MVGQTRLRFMPEETANAHRANDLEIVRDREARILEEPNLEADGLHTYLTLKYPLFRKDGTVYAVGGTSLDITDRKRAEDALRESRALLQAAMDQSPAGIAIADAPDGKLRFVNDAGLLIRGGTRETVVNGVGVEQYVASWQLLDLDERPLRPDEVPLARAVLFGETCSREFIVRRDSDDDRIVLGNAAPIKDAAGKVTAGIVVFSDVTETRRAETELRRYRDELEQLVAERTAALQTAVENLRASNLDLEQFAYVASHDLQQPLRMVASFVERLSMDYSGKLDEAANTYIRIASENAHRMSHLIQGLLAYSRIGSREGRVVSTSASEAVRLALSNLQAVLGEAGGEVFVGDLPVVRADGVQLVQLFQNLIGNAVKYRGESPLRVRVEALREPGLWHFTVADNGIGIDPKYFDRIFLIFQRLHAPGHYEGTGIGLSLCKKIVERHGGRIWVESVPGSGSTFHFTIADRGGSE